MKHTANNIKLIQGIIQIKCASDCENGVTLSRVLFSHASLFCSQLFPHRGVFYQDFTVTKFVLNQHTDHPGHVDTSPGHPEVQFKTYSSANSHHFCAHTATLIFYFKKLVTRRTSAQIGEYLVTVSWIVKFVRCGTFITQNVSLRETYMLSWIVKFVRCGTFITQNV